MMFDGKWDKNIYILWMRHEPDFMSFLTDYQSFRVLSISLCFVRIHGCFYCIGCWTLISIIIENHRNWPTSWTIPHAGKDVTYIETKFMNFDLTALAMLYHYRNHEFLDGFFWNGEKTNQALQGNVWKPQVCSKRNLGFGVNKHIAV